MPSLFSPEALSKAVHDSLDQATATIPPGKHGALLVDATKDRVQIVLAVKAHEGWTVAGTADYDGHSIQGKVAVAGSW